MCYIPDLTERFPEGFGGVDLTDSFFGGGYYNPYDLYDPYEVEENEDEEE